MSRASEAGHADERHVGLGLPGWGHSAEVLVVGWGRAGHQSWRWGLLFVLSRVGRRALESILQLLCCLGARRGVRGLAGPASQALL